MGALRPGQLLEGTSYQVVREIGSGGMGVVYEIEHVRLRKRYVAKVIHDQIRNDEGAQKRMEREAQVLAEISHPNVVQVHDVGTTSEGVSYFVMEKLSGVDLRSAMKKGGVTRKRALAVIVDVLEALSHVHERGIVHRDIKPENIFLSQQPTGIVTKVLDFGIVHIFDGDGRGSQGRITKTGGFVGTLYYAAPEQMQGRAAGPGNDVYACALVLFELLVGRGPFDDDPGVGLSRCFKPAPRLDAIGAIPRELSDVVARALEQDPALRPSASELASELRAVSAMLASAPGAAEDEAVRDEVAGLLENMELLSARAPLGSGGPGHEPPEPSPYVASAAGPTAMPPTPLMAGAPGRSAPFSIDPTLASGAVVPFGGSTARAAAAAPFATAPTIGSATFPPHPAAAISQPSGPAQPSPPPDVSTSPGLYATVDATVDNARFVTTAPGMHAKKTPWAPIAGAIAALLFVVVGASAWIAHRSGVKSSTTTASTTVEPPSPAVAAPLPSAKPAASSSEPVAAASAPAVAAAAPSQAPSAKPASSPAAASSVVTSVVARPAGPASTASPTTGPNTSPNTSPNTGPNTRKGAEKDGYVKEL